MSDGGPVIASEGVTYRYPGSATAALTDVSFDIRAGSFGAVLGPNGAGKSTLARVVAGIARPDAGEVFLAGRKIQDWDRSELARTLAVVAQDAPPEGLALDVRAYIELGRNPYVSPWAALDAKDHDIVSQALAWADLEHLADRPLTRLSGGERQRAKLARAFAQEPEILLLDEPTVHLDFGHALWLFEALGRWVADGGLTVLCITHDMQLASRYADHLLLLAEGRTVAWGRPDDVLTAPVLEKAYRCDVHVASLEDLGLLVVPTGLPESTAAMVTR